MCDWNGNAALFFFTLPIDMNRLNKAAVYDKQYWGFTVVAFRIEEVVQREFKGPTGFEYVYSCMHVGINMFVTKLCLFHRHH